MNPKFVAAAALVAGVMLAGAAVVWTQGSTSLPVASVGAATDIPGAQELPDPNIELKKAGVDLRVCGQGLLGGTIDRAQVLPDIQVDLWAMTTMVNLQMRGYVRIGG